MHYYLYINKILTAWGNAMKLSTKFTDNEFSLDGYISTDGNQVTTAIFTTFLPGAKGDYCLGAYYGYAGGGVNDGGFFSIDIENSVHKHIDFDELDEMYEDNKDHYGVLESLMQKIWHFVDEDEGIMELTNNGLKLERDEDGFWISDNFDGDMLAEISELWSISLRFYN
jgi:hypothetical protein